MPTKKDKQPLSVTHPDLAKEADGWDPSEVTFGSGIKRQWKCKFGHIWINSPNSRIGIRVRGCPICSNSIVQPGVNDLASTHPEICSEIVIGDPTTVTYGSKTKFLWKCPNEHTYKASIDSRAGRGSKCPKCLNRFEQKKYASLDESFPEIARDAFEWDPQSVSGASGSSRKWKCPLGHIYEMKIDKRTLRGQGCPFCSGHKVLIGFNDVETTHKYLLKEVDGWDPTKYSKGSEYKANWKCKEGHKWRAFIVNRTLHNQGCPSCAVTGFDPNEEGFLYFMEHLQWEMLQIGITNYPDDRLRSHKKLGWELVEIRGPMDGHITQQWETAILRMLKTIGADISNAEIAGKFDGYSEAWSKSTFEAKSIKELMRMTEEFEEK